MDQDFFKDIKDRLSNPFFISFIISWLIYNWPIVISILLYKRADLEKDNYVSFYDLIDSRQSTRHMIIYPLVSAVAYCVFFPWIKAAIEWIQARATSWGDSEVLKATKAGWMPFQSYIDMRDTMQQSIESLKELNLSQGITKEENNKLSTENIELENKILLKDADVIKSNETLLNLQKVADLATLAGKWEVIEVSQTGITSKKEWHIESNSVTINPGSISRIVKFIANPFTNDVTLQLENIGSKVLITYVLKRSSDLNTLHFSNEQGLKDFKMVRKIFTNN
jgi:hypothetical protein